MSNGSLVWLQSCWADFALFPAWDTLLAPVPAPAYVAPGATASDVNPDAKVPSKPPKSKFVVDSVVARLYGRPAPKEEDY